MNIKGKGQRLIPEELLKYLEALKNKYPDAVDLVEANPTLEGDEGTLSSVLINGTKYAVGGGSEVHLYRHDLSIINTINPGQESYVYMTLYLSTNSAITSVSNLRQVVTTLISCTGMLWHMSETHAIINYNGETNYLSYIVSGGINNDKTLSGTITDTITQIF